MSEARGPVKVWPCRRRRPSGRQRGPSGISVSRFASVIRTAPPSAARRATAATATRPGWHVVVAAVALLAALGGAVLITLANRETEMPNTSTARPTSVGSG